MKTPHDGIDPDAVPTAEELAQAEALAQTLERRPAEATPPVPAELVEALETAALLRQAEHASVPEPVLEGLPTRPTRRPWWLWPALAVPATAGVLLVAAIALPLRSPSLRSVESVSLKGASIPIAASVAARPMPPASLLRAQAELARGDRQALAALDAEMRRYRASFYGSQGGR